MTMRTPLRQIRGLGSAKSGTEHFWRQRLTAIANVPLVIGFIVIVTSLLDRNHATVVQILGSPIVAILMLLFILSVTYHMGIGMQVIIGDYARREGTRVVLLIANTFFVVAIGMASACAILKLSCGV
jgi:succinate dehydrogenase / fumarate reductase, membrane anchor subunit